MAKKEIALILAPVVMLFVVATGLMVNGHKDDISVTDQIISERISSSR